MEKQFFDGLQEHSEVKLKILEKYVIPWMRKIVLGTLAYGGKCLVIDGFAGQGKYGSNDADGSPLILLKSAIDFCEQAREKNWQDPEIYFIFIEGSPANFGVLKQNIAELIDVEIESNLEGNLFFAGEKYPTINVACLNDDFKNVLETLLKGGKQLIPTFCFIDPFGFSQTPFKLIEKFMRNERAEILLNFIYEETNRFLNHPSDKIQEHLNSHFGVEKLDELKDLVNSTDTPKQREQQIVNYYSRQLNIRAKVNHVLNFAIKKKGRTKLVLFFGTNNIKGLDTMKQAMWTQDNTGTYLFDARNRIDQIEFNFVNESIEATHVSNLATLIFSCFKGKQDITKEQIEHYVIISTIYPTGTLVTQALKELEKTERITNVRKIEQGKKRKAGTFKEVYIRFAN